MIVGSQNNFSNLQQKSCKVLSSLLDQQINQNQILSKQNNQLEQQQKKLIALLQIKTLQLKNINQQVQQLQNKVQLLHSNLIFYQQKLQINHEIDKIYQESEIQEQNFIKPSENGHNDTTLQQTILLSRSKFTLMAQTERNSLPESRNNTKENNNSKQIEELQNKLALLRQQHSYQILQFQQLEQTSQRQKEYYINAIEQLQLKSSAQKQSLKQKISQLEQALKSNHQQSAESLLKNRKTYQQMTRQILQLQEKSHELSMVEKILNDKEEKIKTLKKNESKLIDELSTMQQKYSELKIINQKDKQESIQLYEQEIQSLRKTIQTNQKNHSKQLESSRASILEQTKQCILQQIQKQKQFHDQQIKNKQSQLMNIKKQYRQILEKNQHQLQLIIQIQDRNKQLQNQINLQSKQISDLNNSLKQNIESKTILTHQTLQYKKIIDQLSNKLKQNQIQLKEIKQHHIQFEQFKNQDQKNFLNKLNKLKSQCDTLSNSYRVLQEENQNLQLSLETSQLEVEKLNQKIIKEQIRKDKLIAEYKNTFDQFKQQNESLTTRNEHLQKQITLSQQSGQQIERKLTKQLSQIRQKNNQLLKQNSIIKQQVKQIELRMKNLLNELQKKHQQSQHEIEILSKNLKQLSLQKQHYKKLNQQLKQYNHKIKQDNYLINIKNQQFKSILSSTEIEIQHLKNQIVNSQLNTNQKEEFQKLRNQHYQYKAKINYHQQANLKYKQQIEDLTKDLISLNQSAVHLKLDLEKGEKLEKTLRQEINTLATKNKQLQKSLKDRCSELDKSMPYMNQVIEQKKIMQSQLQKLISEVKKKDGLLQIAKRSKADEIIHMRQQIFNLSKKLQVSENESKEVKQLLEKHNRQKVNIIRENVSKGDDIKKLQKQNKVLKQQLVKMKEIQSGLQQQLQSVYKVMEEQQIDEYSLGD